MLPKPLLDATTRDFRDCGNAADDSLNKWNDLREIGIFQWCYLENSPMCERSRWPDNEIKST